MKEMILNNGVKIPSLGIGGWAMKKENMLDAINVGYTLIDTASQYGNEAEIGDAIQQSGVGRHDIFLTTKLWTEDIRQRRTREAFEKSLIKLKTDYVDLYLIHWPAEGFEEAYLTMEKLYKEGKIRALGVSNFEEHHLKELKSYGAEICPAINQVESHPFFSNSKIIEFGKSKGIFTEAWCPLGGPGSGEIKNDTIVRIAEKVNKTTSQVILRWHLQRDVIVIPKSSNINRMIENSEIFDFELSDEDMKAINELEIGKRLGTHPDKFDF